MKAKVEIIGKEEKKPRASRYTQKLMDTIYMSPATGQMFSVQRETDAYLFTLYRILYRAWDWVGTTTNYHTAILDYQ